jgi:hypothetical protein
VIEMVEFQAPQVEMVYSFKLTPELLSKIEEIVRATVNSQVKEILAEAVNSRLEEVVKKCLEETAKESKTEESGDELRKIPKKEAVALIKKYVDNHQGCLTSDIVFGLKLDLDLVIKCLHELEKDTSVRGEPIEKESEE